jgi:hypothetical protein
MVESVHVCRSPFTIGYLQHDIFIIIIISTRHSQKRTGPPLTAWFLSTRHSQKRTGHPSEPGSSLSGTARRGLATPESLVPLYPAQPEEDWPPLRPWFLSTQYSQKRTGHPA